MCEYSVSIIIVNYNSFHHTQECVKSLLKIDYSNFDIWIVDNGSNKQDRDDLTSLAVYEKVNLVFSSVNSGFAGGNNIGIKKVLDTKRPDFFLLLNEDTVVEKDFLSQMICCFSNDNRVGMISPKIMDYNNKHMVRNAGGHINLTRGTVNVPGGRDDKRFNKEGFITFASGCCMLIKYDALKEVGLMPEEYFLYYEDTEYCLRFLKKGYKLWYEPGSVIYHKKGGSTITFSPTYQYYYLRGRLMFIKRNFNFINKLTAYPITFLFAVKSIITGKAQYSNTRQAIVDFFRNKTGIRD